MKRERKNILILAGLLGLIVYFIFSLFFPVISRLPVLLTLMNWAVLGVGLPLVLYTLAAKVKLERTLYKVLLISFILAVVALIYLLVGMLHSEYEEEQCYKKVDANIPYSERYKLLDNLSEQEKKSVGIEKGFRPTRSYYEMLKCTSGID